MVMIAARISSSMKRCGLLFVAAYGVAILAPSSIGAAAPACDPDNGGLKLPAGFCALVAADGVGTARHLVVGANGDVYVALRGQTPGGIVALRDKDGDGRLETKEPFGTGSSTGIALRNGYLYVVTLTTVERYKVTPGQL